MLSGCLDDPKGPQRKSGPESWDRGVLPREVEVLESRAKALPRRESDEGGALLGRRCWLPLLMVVVSLFDGAASAKTCRFEGESVMDSSCTWHMGKGRYQIDVEWEPLATGRINVELFEDATGIQRLDTDCLTRLGELERCELTGSLPMYPVVGEDWYRIHLHNTRGPMTGIFRVDAYGCLQAVGDPCPLPPATIGGYTFTIRRTDCFPCLP